MNNISKQCIETTGDGEEHPNNHLGFLLKSWKLSDKPLYQLVKMEVVNPHVHLENSLGYLFITLDTCVFWKVKSTQIWGAVIPDKETGHSHTESMGRLYISLRIYHKKQPFMIGKYAMVPCKGPMHGMGFDVNGKTHRRTLSKDRATYWNEMPAIWKDTSPSEKKTHAKATRWAPQKQS